MLNSLDIDVITLSREDLHYGCIDSLLDAHKCTIPFKRNKDNIDGILVRLTNFRDERAIANTLRWSGLDVLILIHAYSDASGKMLVASR